MTNTLWHRDSMQHSWPGDPLRRLSWGAVALCIGVAGCPEEDTVNLERQSDAAEVTDQDVGELDAAAAPSEVDGEQSSDEPGADVAPSEADGEQPSAAQAHDAEADVEAAADAMTDAALAPDACQPGSNQGCAASQTCQRESGAARCVDGNLLGEADFDGAQMWRPWTVELDTGIFFPVVPPSRATLDAFNLRGAVKGGTCRMALYADAAGAPGTLLAIGFSPLQVDVGVQSVTADGHITLDAGQTYWIGGKCTHAVGAQLYQRDAPGAVYYRFAQPTGVFTSHPQGERRMGLAFGFFVSTHAYPE